MNFNHLFKKIVYIILLVLLTSNLKSAENSIIFKINEKAYTSFDYENRLQYFDFVSTDQNLTKELIIDDYISVLLFHEYYKNNNPEKDHNNKIEEIFYNIKKTNDNNNKIYKYDINKENILLNIKLDYTRKIVLENILNLNKDKLNSSNEEIDLLYEYKINYFNFTSDNYKNILRIINKEENINIEKIKNILKNNNIEYFNKEKEINNINKLDNRIKKNILLNNNFFIINNDKKISLIFLSKKFETLNSLIAEIYSVKSKNELNNKYLNCKNLIKLKNDINIINKEYKFTELNKELKENLISINDHIKFINEDEFIYVILCNIKFDKKTFENYNFNKLINKNVNEIEKKFIKKYSKIYNLIKN